MPSGVYQHHPCSEETKQKISRANKGRKHSEETKKKWSRIRKGITSNTGRTHFKKGQTAWNKGKPSPWAKKNPQIFKKGHISWNKGITGFMAKERHWNWKGGITTLTGQIRSSFKYRQWRSDVFTRDYFTCVLCGKKERKIEADHYPKRFSEIFHENKIKTFEEAMDCEEFWNINNGRTLCLACHNKTRRG